MNAAIVYGTGTDAVVLGHITTNHGITKADALDLIGIDMDAYAQEHGWDGWVLDEIRCADPLGKRLADWVRDNAPSEVVLEECGYCVNGAPVTLEGAADALIESANETADVPYDESLTGSELAYLGGLMLDIIDRGENDRFDPIRIRCETVRDGYAVYDADGNADETFRTRREAMDWLQSGVNSEGEEYDLALCHVAPYRGVIE